MDTRKIYAQASEPHTTFEFVESAHSRQLRERARTFAWEYLEPKRDEVDDKGTAHELMPLLAEHGLLSQIISEKRGGTGEGLEGSVAVAQELGGVMPSLAAMRAISSTFVAKPLDEFATPEQVDRFLLPLLTGNVTSALTITEPHTGSDIADLKTHARRDGDGWVINGAKKHISGAAEATFLLLYAVTNPDAPTTERMTAFLVPTSTPGITIRRESTMGVRGLSHTEIDLDGVRIDDGCRLGDVGDGMRLIYFTLAAERIDIAARALGCGARAFEEARAFSAVRGGPTRPISRFQAVSHRLADMRTTIDAGRLLVLRAARLYDATLAEHGAEEANRICDEESSIAKLFCGQQAFHVCDDAMQIMGGLGYEQGTAVEAMFRDSRVFRFGGGTDEIQRHIIQREEYRRFQASRTP